MDHSYSQSQLSAKSSVMKPLTERQQMALLLQMTAEDNSTPTRKKNCEEKSPNLTPRSINRRNERGETPLHVAAIRGDLRKVRELILKGADVNTSDYAGWTPLHEAANRGHVAVTNELLRSGAMVNAVGMDSITPLHDAAVNGHEHIIMLLLRYGAKPTLKTAAQKTAQELAGTPQVVRLLAQFRPEPSNCANDENSPTMIPVNKTESLAKKQYPKSRRSLKLDCPTLKTDVKNFENMESATVSNSSTTDDSKEVKTTNDNETTVTHSAPTDDSVREDGRESDCVGDSQTAVKRGAEGDDENDEDVRKKRKKAGDEVKELKGRVGPAGKGKDRKSPNTIQNDTADSDEDKKSNELKVPPLKIVLSNSNEVDTNVRSKNGNGRGSLAYVVSNNEEKSENSNGGSDKGEDKLKDGFDGEKSMQSSNGGRVTRSSQRAAAHQSSTAPSAPTSGQNSANQSPTSSPTQTQTNQTPSPADTAENIGETQPAASSVKVEDVKSEEPTVEVHPRKRKLRPREPEPVVENPAPTANATVQPAEATPAPTPITNCYDMYLSIRKQIERRHRNLLPVQPKPPQGFKDYLMNRCSYVIAGNTASRLSVPVVSPPPSLLPPMRDLFSDQEKERYRLRMQHLIEKEKLVLSVEQEILRVHGRAARALANQALPFSVCTLLKDQEVYSALTPEQEEKDRNARSRYNGRLFLSWLQDVDDKWEKIKESMLLRHHNEAESLHAVQRMDWEWKVKELGLCEPQNKPVIDDLHVPMVNVSDDFDLLPA